MVCKWVNLSSKGFWQSEVPSFGKTWVACESNAHNVSEKNTHYPFLTDTLCFIHAFTMTPSSASKGLGCWNFFTYCFHWLRFLIGSLCAKSAIYAFEEEKRGARFREVCPRWIETVDLGGFDLSWTFFPANKNRILTIDQAPVSLHPPPHPTSPHRHAPPIAPGCGTGSGGTGTAAPSRGSLWTACCTISSGPVNTTVHRRSVCSR